MIKPLKSLNSLPLPKIMGILNLTPDSFYDGGTNSNISIVMKKVDQMVKDGMDIIDVGGMSSRPGAEIIDADQEWNRIKDTLLEIKKNYPDLRVSVDTIHASIASKALKMGVEMINDISGGYHDPLMLDVLADSGKTYVMMHMKGQPKNMQKHTQYKNLIDEMSQYFEEQIERLDKKGFHNIILDPGFGFGKTLEDNYFLMKNIDFFTKFGKPILAGISRKSMIYKLVNAQATQVLPETTALHWYLLGKKVDYLRVHDVKVLSNIKKIYPLIQNDLINV